MAVVAKQVGMERREYTGQDGKKRQFCRLHLLHLESSARDVKGCRVETVSCPRKNERQMFNRMLWISRSKAQ